MENSDGGVFATGRIVTPTGSRPVWCGMTQPSRGSVTSSSVASRLRKLPDFPTGFASVFAATMVTLLAVGAALPVLPRYVKGPIGGGDVEVGLVIGAFAFAAILARPFAGRVGDRRGRQPVMVTGALMAAAAGALYMLPTGVVGLVLTRMLLGAGEGIVFTSGAAWVADLANENNRGRLVGLYGLSIWSGVAIGPLVGEAIFQSTGSYDAVWAFCAFAPAASIPLLIALPGGRDVHPHAQANTGLSSFLPRETLRPGLALMTACLGYAAVGSFLVLMLDHKHIGHGAIAFGVFATSVIVVRFIFGDLPDRFGGRACAIGAAALEMTGLLLLAAAGSLTVSLLAAALMGVGFSLIYPSLALLVLDEVGPARRGVAMGAFTAFFDLGIAFGSPLVGIAAAAKGYPAAFVAGACGALLSAVIVSGAKSGSKHDEGDQISSLNLSEPV